MEATKEQALVFLEKINPKDKVAIIHHDDLDGFASGIMLYDLCLKQGVNEKNIKNYILPIGGDQKAIVKELPKFDKILIADLAPNTIGDILDFASSEEKETIYFDHHASDMDIPENVLEIRDLRKSSASRIIYDILGTEKEFLKVASLICDVGWMHEDNVKELQPYLKASELTLNDIKTQAYILGYSLVYFSEDLDKAFEMIKDFENWSDVKKLEKYAEPVEKDLDKWVNGFEKNKEVFGKIIFYYFEPKYNVKSIAINKLSFPRPDDIFVFATPNETTGIKLSARNQTRSSSMIDLLKAGIHGLKDSSAGGHIPAAGGFIQEKDLPKFKENLKKYAEKLK